MSGRTSGSACLGAWSKVPQKFQRRRHLPYRLVFMQVSRGMTASLSSTFRWKRPDGAFRPGDRVFGYASA